MAAIIFESDGRKIRMAIDAARLVLTEKTGRGKPPKVVSHDVLGLMDGGADNVLDDLIRKLPVADLDGIRPDRLGYELKVRLMALVKPKQEPTHEETETPDAGGTTDAGPRSVDRRVSRRTGRGSKRRP